jgi:transcriptional regulator with XRE-family HTH domain
MRINRTLAEIVEKRGIKQSYIAEKTGMSPDMVSKTLRGDRKLTAEEFLIFCEVLDISPELFRNGQVA